jgi:hypothetical protein
MSNLSILQHALGVDQYGRGQQHRNHYCAAPGHHSWSALLDLVRQGHMTRRTGSPISGGADIFQVTSLGKTWMFKKSPAPPKLTAGQRRYQDFLDADCDMRFGDWLKWKSAQRKYSHA